MPNLLPPIVSSSPPPLDPIDYDDNEDDHENDDFGDFSTADFASDCSVDAKVIADTVQTQPKHLVGPPSVTENGIIEHEPSTRENPPENVFNHPSERFNDKDSSGNVGNTSQDSPVSTEITCNISVAQNNNILSSTNSQEEDEKKYFFKSSGQPYCSKEELHNEFLFKNLEVSESLSSETYQVSRDLVRTKGLKETTLSPNSELHPSILDCAAIQQLDFPTEVSVSSDIVENRDFPELGNNLRSSKNLAGGKRSDDLTCIEKDNGGSVDLGYCCSSSTELTNNANEDNHVGHSENECNGSEFTFRTSDDDNKESSCKPELTMKFDGNIESDCVRAMIIPDVLGLDDDSDDEFGEFSGIPSDDIYPSETECEKDKSDFDSPSKTTMLVLPNDPEEAVNGSISSFPNVQTNFSDEPAVMCPYSDSKGVVEDLHAASTTSVKEKDQLPSAVHLSSVDDPVGDEFADFTQAELTNNTQSSNLWAQAALIPPALTQLPTGEPAEFDDFDDFESADFQSAAGPSEKSPSSHPPYDPKTIKLSLEKLFKESFPSTEEVCSLSDVDNIGASGLSGIILDVEESYVWQALRDLEATPSLSFQWPGSHSNRGLLGSLSIDSRNILFGPKWNTVVPRFAANLGFSPLEPVRAAPNQPSSEPSSRSEVIKPDVVESIKSASDQAFQDVVPAAQFDWSDSGLINPLDSNNPGSGPLATTAASGNPVLTTSPLQVEQLLANSKRSAPLPPLEQKNRDSSLSPEAVRVLDTLPELAFLSARMLMFPVQSDHSENKL